MRFNNFLAFFVCASAVSAAVLFEPAEKSFVTHGGARASVAANHIEWPGAGVRLEFASASTPTAEPLDQAPRRVSYLIGNDPSRWRLDVRQYARIRYRGVYPKTDLLYHGSASDLEFDFVLQPGASPEAISLRFDAPLLRADGVLVARGQSGEVRLHRPLAWQEINGKRVLVIARFAMRSANTAGFEVAAFDHALPLIIDPIVQVATYYGGATGNETNIQMVTDPSGNVYLAGATTSVDLPQATFPGSAYSRPGELLQSLCFLTRMHPDGTTVDYAIYFGGSGGDVPLSLIRDNLGFIHVMGSTNSPNFPVPSSAWRTSILPNSADTFWAKFDPQTGKLLAATFIGAASQSYDVNPNLRLAVDSVGEAFIGGNGTAAFIATTGAYFTNSAAAAGFIVRINASGTGVIYASFLPFVLLAIQVDALGGVLIAGGGQTYYGGNPTIINPLPGTSAPVSGENYGYLARLNPSGSALTFASYLGSQINSITEDPSGNMHILGTAQSLGVPVTNPVHLGPAVTGSAGTSSPFWVELQANTNTVLAATLFSDGSPAPFQFTFLPNGSICMLATGSTFTQAPGGLGVTNQAQWGLTCLDQNGTQYFTTEIPYGIASPEFLSPTIVIAPSIGLAPAPDGGVWIASQTNGSLQTTPGVIQPNFAGGYTLDEGSYEVGPYAGTDAAVMKISPLNPTPAIEQLSPPAAVLGSQSLTLNISGTGFGYGTQLLWNGTTVPITLTSTNAISLTVGDPNLLVPGSVTLTASLPAPGGGSSNPVTLQLLNPAPYNLFLSPSQIPVGSSPVGLLIMGDNRLPSSTVTWDGQPRTVTYATQYNQGSLQLTLSASDLTAAGAHTIAVTNAAPGGESTSAVFKVTTTSSISLSANVPVVVNPSSGVYLVALGESGLSSGASATWDGTSVPFTITGGSIILSVPAQILQGQSRHVAAVTQGGQTISTVVYVAISFNIAGAPAVDPVGQKIYYIAQQQNYPPTAPSSLVITDFSLRTLNTVSINAVPTRLYTTDDGSFVYMLDNGGTIYRFNTTTLAVDFQFTLDPNVYSNTSALATIPGQPDSIMALSGTQITIFDQGVARPNIFQTTNPSVLAVTSDRVYVGTIFSPVCPYWVTYDQFGLSASTITSCDPSVSGLQQDSLLSYVTSGSRIVPLVFGNLTASNIFPDLPDQHVVLMTQQGISDWNLATLSSAVVFGTTFEEGVQLDNTRILILNYSSAFVFDRTNP